MAVAAYETWGFTGLQREVIDVLNRWAAFVYAPLMEDRPRLIEETNATTYGREVAEKVHGELKRLGGVKPPREFVMVDRAAIGLGGVFLRLGPRSTGTGSSTTPLRTSTRKLWLSTKVQP